MSGENTEIVRQGLDAYNRRDLDGMLEVTHPEVELVAVRSLMEGGSYHGYDGIRRFLSDMAEDWEDLTLEPDDYRESGGRVVVLGNFKGRGKTSGIEVQSPLAWVVEVRDRRVVRIQAYSSQAEALEAVGLAG